MRSLIRKISKHNLSIKARNYLNIKPVRINTNLITNNNSISDAFFWRTDNNFSTIFKFTDLLNQFYHHHPGQVEIVLLSKNFKLIKSIKINLNSINNFIIDKNIVNCEDYGTFYIFHKSKKNNVSIRNSCYTGYFQFRSAPSFVHGNLPTTFQKFRNIFNSDKTYEKNFSIIGSSFFSNQVYKIQKSFLYDDRVEILLNNPTNNVLKININDKNKFILKPGFSNITNLTKPKTIKIKSNCYLLRPIVFNYRKNNFDVFHG